VSSLSRTDRSGEQLQHDPHPSPLLFAPNPRLCRSTLRMETVVAAAAVDAAATSANYCHPHSMPSNEAGVVPAAASAVAVPANYRHCQSLPSSAAGEWQTLQCISAPKMLAMAGQARQQRAPADTSGFVLISFQVICVPPQFRPPHVEDAARTLHAMGTGSGSRSGSGSPPPQLRYRQSNLNDMNALDVQHQHQLFQNSTMQQMQRQNQLMQQMDNGNCVSGHQATFPMTGENFYALHPLFPQQSGTMFSVQPRAMPAPPSQHDRRGIAKNDSIAHRPGSPDGVGSSSAGSGQRDVHRCIYPGCSKTFDRRYNLSVHSRRHTDETPYSCKVAGCTQMFKWRSSLAHHNKTRHRALVSSGITKMNTSPTVNTSMVQLANVAIGNVAGGISMQAAAYTAVESPSTSGASSKGDQMMSIHPTPAGILPGSRDRHESMMTPVAVLPQHPQQHDLHAIQAMQPLHPAIPMPQVQSQHPRMEHTDMGFGPCR
jgi:hypothetical protein